MSTIAQIFGIFGLVLLVSSLQFKKNTHFFLLQGLGSFMFFLNFILIGAYGGAFFNLCNLFRGLLFLKNAKKKWKLALISVAYFICFAYSSYLTPIPREIILVAIPCVSLFVMSALMWQGNAKRIRWCQIFISSPAWIIHNVFNLSVGGILCECFNIVSSVVYLIRQRMEKKA